MIIANEEKEVLTQGVQKSNAFRIETSPKAFEILSSNIYTHKVRAVIREICCNAHDAHVSANNVNKDFDVHIPTKLEPWFSVRDYGAGLDEESVMNLYTTYFYSNKDKSNDFIGGMGIGSKAFYCISDTATVTSYYNGEKTVYTCYKNESGQPCIAKLVSVETDEPNGLEVSVNAENNINEWKEEAIEVFMYFDKIPNINMSSVIDEINRIKNKYILSTDNFSLRQSGGLKAVMGNVAYRIPEEYNKNYLSGIIKFNIGDLSFDPGRENLSLDDRTRNKLKERLKEIKEEVAKAIYDKVSKEPTVFRKAIETRKILNTLGKTIIHNTSLHDEISKLSNIPLIGHVVSYYRERRSVSKTHQSYFPYSENTEYFLEKPRFEKRIQEYIKCSGSNVVLLSQDQINHAKVDPEFIKDLESLPKATYSPRQKTSNKKLYRVINMPQTVCSVRKVTGCGVNVEKSLLSPSQHVYLVAHRDTIISNKFTWLYQINALFEAIKIEHDIVIIKKSEENKFKAQGYISIDDYVGKIKHDTIYSYSEDVEGLEKLYEKINSDIDHPVFPMLHKLMGLKKSAIRGETNFAKCGLKVDSTTIDTLVNQIYDKFPILRLIGWVELKYNWDIVNKYLMMPIDNQN